MPKKKKTQGNMKNYFEGVLYKDKHPRICSEIEQIEFKPSYYRIDVLALPISGGKLKSELFERSRTERRHLYASIGYSFNCMQHEINDCHIFAKS
jgi:hypothetical protein